MATGFIDRFSDAADRYRRSRPTYPDELFEALAELAPGRELAWDCGTGNGQAAVGLARHFAAVHATDPSPQQLAEAVPGHGITYGLEQAESVSLSDGSADLVLAAQSLHWFDRPRFYAEAQRVLKPGGVLAAVGYNWMYVDPVVDHAINTRILPLLEPYWAPQNAILWKGYQSIDFPGQELQLFAFAIYLDWSFDQARDYIANWSATRALVAARGEVAFKEAMRVIAPLWGPDARRVIMPLHLRAARL